MLKARLASVVLALLLPFCAFGEGAEANLRTAQIFLRHGRLEAARRSFRKFLEARPDDRRVEDVSLTLAEIAYALGDEYAADAFRRHLARYGYADALGRARYGLAEAWFRRGDYAESLRALKGLLAADIDPGSPYLPFARLRMGWAKFMLGETESAEKEFRRLAALFEGSPLARRARLGLAACAFARGEYAEAQGMYAEALTAEPEGSALAPLAAAGKALSALREDDAVLPDETLARLVPPTYYVEAVRFALARGKHEAAASALRALGAEGWLSDAGVAALRKAGRAWAELPEGEAPETALALLAQAEHRLSLCQCGNCIGGQASSLSPESRRPYGKATAGRTSPARAVLEPAQRSPTLCEEALQRFLDAAAAFGEAEQRAAQAFALTKAGLCSEHLAKNREATSLYEQAIPLAGGRLAEEAMAGAARSAVRSGQWEKALALSQQLLAANPSAATRTDALLAQGAALVATGQPERAVGILAEASAAPASAAQRNAALLWSARAFADSGEGGEAVEAYRDLLAADDGCECRFFTSLELGMELLRAGRPGKTIETLAPLSAESEHADEDAASWADWLLGKAHEAKGDWGQAAGHFARAAERALSAPLAADSLRRKARCFYKKDDAQRAAIWLEVALADHRASLPPETLMWAAVHWHEAGRFDKALVFLVPLIGDDMPAATGLNDAFFNAQAERDGFLGAFAEQALFLAARCLAKEQRWKEAAVAAGRLAKDYPGSRFATAAAADWAEALIRMGRPDEARAVLSPLGTGLPRLAWLAAESYRAENRSEEAVLAYETALQRMGEALDDGWKFRLNAGLGRTLLDAGHSEEATAAFRRAAQAMPTEPELMAERMRLLGEMEGGEPQ